jgi:diguanylate cyclase (GGDEF)-like protein
LIAMHTRATDVAARMGGEEFTVLLTGSDEAEAREFAARVRAALASSDRLSTPVVRMSAGVAACQAPSNLESCLQQADSALYEAKLAGRDRIVIHREAPARHDSGLPRRGAKLLDRARQA